jgi:hypothetical protein
MQYGNFTNNPSVDAAIYRCFDLLSDADARAFATKFRKQPLAADQIKHTFRELILGAFLADNRLAVQHERPIGSKTPDWSILENGDLKCIVEVVNFHTDQPIRDAIDAQLTAGGMAMAFQPDHSIRLYGRLESKFTAYARILQQYELPYAVGLFLQFDAPVNREQIDVCIFAEADGLFAAHPSVTGLMIYDEMAGTYRFNYIPNPHATRPFTLPGGQLNLSLLWPGNAATSPRSLQSPPPEGMSDASIPRTKPYFGRSFAGQPGQFVRYILIPIIKKYIKIIFAAGADLIFI